MVTQTWLKRNVSHRRHDGNTGYDMCAYQGEGDEVFRIDPGGGTRYTGDAMKRVGLIQFHQETNTFNPILTDLELFESLGIAEGAEVLARFGDTNEIGGFVAGLRTMASSPEIVGLFSAKAWAAGPLGASTTAQFVNRICEQIRQAAPLDALLIALHGALVSEDKDDVEGDLLETIREIVGPSMPIVVTLDPHALLTAKMMANADALVPYHTAPHVDHHETGMRGAAVLEQIWKGAKPSYAVRKLPMITQAESQDVRQGALSVIFSRLRALEKELDVLSAGVFMTQAWLDVPQLGWSTMVITNGNPKRGQQIAAELANSCWESRAEGQVEFATAQESLNQALMIAGKPVVIADGADSTNSGACGDSTHLLQEMVARSITGGALTFMVAPDAVEWAQKAGVGADFQYAVGGKRDSVFSRPLHIAGKIVSLQPLRFVLFGHGGRNLPVDMGMSATVRIGDVTLLLVELPGPGSSPIMYRTAGLEPKNFKIVTVKSPAGFRADFEPFAAGIVLADCPGCASPRFAELPFRRISHPLWPIDQIEDPWAVDWCKEVYSAHGTVE